MVDGLLGRSMYLNEKILELKNICKNFKEENKDSFDPQKFSPNFYNHISFEIFESLLTLLDESLRINDYQKLNENLALVTITDLQVKLCMHYFKISEKKFIGDKKSQNTNNIKKNIRKVFYPIYENYHIGKKIKKNKINVGCLNPTTFSWISLNKKLKKDNINLIKVDLNQTFYFSNYDLQLNMFSKKINELHISICEKLHLNEESTVKFEINKYFNSLKFVTKDKSKINKKNYNLIIAGSMGNSPLCRAIILNNIKDDIPCILLHHGASYHIYDEPFYDIYEGLIFENKIVYGDVEKLDKLDLLGPKINIYGKKINFFSRTDKLVENLNKKKSNLEINLKNLTNLKVAYFSSEFTSGRYGPFRDVHPKIYLEWQKSLFSWINQHTGKKPLVKLHPKRTSNEFDPKDNIIITNDIEKIIAEADIFVLDYPTTSFAHVAAFDKPILFFDLGLRKLNKKALRIIKNRFYYSRINILEPQSGLNEMLSDLGRRCNHDFTNIFSKSPNLGSELDIARECIIKNLS